MAGWQAVVMGGKDVADLNRRILALERMGLDDLRREWVRVVKTNPHLRLSADLLRRAVAHRLQELASGGPGPKLLRKLAAAAGRDGLTGQPAITIKAGTTLVREWHGHTHSVRALDEGFEYQGRRFASLTAIAREITGAAWSGPRFFGVQSNNTTFGSKAETTRHV